MRKYAKAIPGKGIVASKIVSVTSGNYAYESYVSFDFIHDGSYDENRIEDVVADVINSAGGQFMSLSFEEVDYSDYPEYEGEVVSQCSADFEHNGDYDQEKIEWYLQDRVEALGYEVIGVDFGAF